MNLAEKELQAEKALRWLHGEAEQVGRDAAAVEYLDEFRKVELARIKNLAFEAESDAAKTAWAMRHTDYLQALQALRDARAKHECNRMKKAAAEGYIAFYQTGSANARANT
jgi:hypothetical protein